MAATAGPLTAQGARACAVKHRMMVPAQLRQQPRWATLQCWQVAGLPCFSSPFSLPSHSDVRPPTLPVPLAAQSWRHRQL